MSMFSTSSALQALLNCHPDRAVLALESVIAEMPEFTSGTDDLSSAKLVDLIFTVLAGIDE